MPKQTSIDDQRRRRLWTLLLWEGQLSNARLRQLFGVKTVAASRMLAAFANSASGLLDFSRREGTWRLKDGKATARHQLITEPGDIDEYTSIVTGEYNPPRWLVDARPDFLDPVPETFRVVREACERGIGLVLTYRSFSSPHGKPRFLYPHAIVRLAQRWHVRAWCIERQQFRDFNIGRMSDVRLEYQAAPKSGDDDESWNIKLDAVIVPHRGLSPAAANMIAQEYFGGADSQLMVERAALLSYVLQAGKIAVNHKTQMPPEYLLELKDAESFKQWLFSVD